jgi:energy-coupling factor transport system substrate-specific component
MNPRSAGQVNNDRQQAGGAGSHWRARGLRSLVLLILLISALPARVVLADAPVPVQSTADAGNRAGLVVRFGDGSVQTACLDLGPDGQATGEELLHAAGLQPIMEYSALGGIVCQIGAEGCGFPEQSCWCQCKGDPCFYWRYFHLVDGQWVYATVGASTHLVHSGQVDGWAWGEGETSNGVQPPLLTLHEICAQPAAVEPAAAEALFTPAPADWLAAQAETAPAAAHGVGLAAPVALAASASSLEAAAPGAGDFALFAGVFLMVVLGATGLRRASAGRPARPRPPHHRFVALPEILVYALSLGMGVVALLYPFLLAAVETASPETARAGDSTLLLFVLLGLCFAALLVEVQGQAVSAKHIALLGMLVAINSVLRFVEVGIPGPGGFSPVFVLIVLTGYVYGGRFGFLLGALTMLVSALITGGVGPWLPAQMFTAGWVGLSAPLARPLVRAAGGSEGSRREVVALALFGGLWGLVYGMVINLWFWPFMSGPASQYYQAGLGLAAVIQRYAAFYLATSLLWDSMAMLGNGLLLLAFGRPALRALRRFRQRFDFDYAPLGAGR